MSDSNITQYICKYDFFHSGLDASFAAPSEESNGALSANAKYAEMGKHHSHRLRIKI